MQLQQIDFPGQRDAHGAFGTVQDRGLLDAGLSAKTRELLEARMKYAFHARGVVGICVDAIEHGDQILA